MTVTILTVCTGNICRSPQAEQLLRAQFGNAVPTTGRERPVIVSAGTHAMVGAPMPDPAAALSLEFGGTPFEHAGRLLTAEMIENADLVLTMSREHRGFVARLFPRSTRYTFTLLEFDRVVEHLTQNADDNNPLPDPWDIEAWVHLIATRRGHSVAVSPAADEVVDPYLRSDGVYRQSATIINGAVSRIVSRLT